MVLLKESGLGGLLGELREKDEKREKNIRKVLRRDEDTVREKEAESWLALVFEFKYQSVEESGDSGPQEPLQPENPRDSDTVFARN